MNGRLIVQTTNVLAITNKMQQNMNYSNHYGWSICLFGNQAHEGDYHHTGFTETTLKVHFLAAGFKIESFKEVDDWLFDITGKKVEDHLVFLKHAQKQNNEEFTHEAFQYAFGREPDEMGGSYIRTSLDNQELTRLQALRHLLESPERLFVTAAKNGFENN